MLTALDNWLRHDHNKQCNAALGLRVNSHRAMWGLYSLSPVQGHTSAPQLQGAAVRVCTRDIQCVCECMYACACLGRQGSTFSRQCDVVWQAHISHET